MKHKHYDLIVAKTANMDLVVFSKRSDSNRWVELEIHKQCVSFNETHSYFLCLPQHKEACLHWLNGGHETLECNSPFTDGFEQCYKLGEWMSAGGYMREDCEYRVKPKKEKRWIVIHNGKLVDELFKCDADIRMSYMSEYATLQKFEIEVEV